MSEGMVERVAKRLCQRAAGESGCPCAETGGFDCAGEHPGRMARAAIEAMRGPTDGMVQTGHEAIGPVAMASVIYGAMIDAALAED